MYVYFLPLVIILTFESNSLLKGLGCASIDKLEVGLRCDQSVVIRFGGVGVQIWHILAHAVEGDLKSAWGEV